MERSGLELTAPEAAVALAALVPFCDDDPSEAEGVVLRKYYRFETAESLQEKLSAAGYNYPAVALGGETRRAPPDRLCYPEPIQVFVNSYTAGRRGPGPLGKEKHFHPAVFTLLHTLFRLLARQSPGHH